MFDDNVPQQQYNVSVNGGSEKVNYFFNLGYLKQEGSYKSGSLNYDRWNFRSNIDAKITDRLKATIQTSGYMDEKNQPFTDIWSVYKKLGLIGRLQRLMWMVIIIILLGTAKWVNLKIL